MKCEMRIERVDEEHPHGKRVFMWENPTPTPTYIGVGTDKINLTSDAGKR